MKVTLLHNTPLSVCSWAIRTCYQSYDKGDNGGEKDKELIDRVGNKNRHSSTLEHLVYNFFIEGISRAVLQELCRHRLASYSVKSTRYTLKELRNEKPFCEEIWDTDKEYGYKVDWDRFEKYCVRTDNYNIDLSNALRLDRIIELLNTTDLKQDELKYLLPESYKTSLTWTINARSLQNFLKLRTSKAALAEIRSLAYSVFDTIPDEHKFIFKDFVEQR